MLIESGTGNGTLAGVDDDNRILTASFNIPFEHLIAKDYQKTFIVQGEATPINGSKTILYVENNSQSDRLVLNRLILTSIVSGGTALPNTSNYFSLDVGSIYQSGGTLVNPVNLSTGSSVVSNSRCYADGYTLASPGSTALKYYASGLTTTDFPLQGGIIILPGKAVSVTYIGDNTGGVVSAAMGFSVVSSDGYSG